MSNHLRRAKNNIKSLALPYYYRYYKHLSKKSCPDFLIIGALKSGTTSLYQYLDNHSQLIGSNKKETNFFSWEYHKGMQYFLSHFPDKKNLNGKMTFESCPHYLPDPVSPGRIKTILPKVKLIAILRDPIERAISNYNYFSNPTSLFGIRNPQELDKRTVDQAFLDDLQGTESRLFRQYCRLSLYGKQLEHYYKKFNPKNMLVLDFDELKESPRTVLSIVSKFLNIDFKEFESFENSNEKISSSESFDKNVSKTFGKYNVQEYSLKLDKSIEQELKDFYKEDIKNLQGLTGIDFKWSNKYS